MYEKLVAKYQDEVAIREEKMPHKLPGLYLNGIILINKNQSTIEKGCVLAEE
ncbi:toxin, partial [Listeria welshimeri]|nr:toxin [Listeria welshimeri]